MTRTSDPETATELKELSDLVTELGARVRALEDHAAHEDAEISEDVLIAISAACAAYLGKRATVKQVHLGRSGAWAAQGRSSVQGSHAGLRGTR